MARSCISTSNTISKLRSMEPQFTLVAPMPDPFTDLGFVEIVLPVLLARVRAGASAIVHPNSQIGGPRNMVCNPAKGSFNDAVQHCVAVESASRQSWPEESKSCEETI